MNEKDFEIRTKIIRELFEDPKAIKCLTPEDMLDLGKDTYHGKDVFTTEDEDFIDLELQLTDFDEDELIKYIGFAEALYEKHQKHVSVYIICPKDIDICVNECVIRSKADFIIKLARIEEDSCRMVLNTIKNKIKNSEMLDNDDIFALSMLSMVCRPEERYQYLREYLKIINGLP